MYRPKHQNANSPGQDSFLDVVTNIVGIVIILVTIVGMRVKHATILTAVRQGTSQISEELHKELATEQSLRGDVLRVADQIRTLQGETLLQGRRRDAMAVMVSTLEHQIGSRRQQMDVDSQATFDVQRSVSESRFQLEQLLAQRAQAQAAKAAPIVIESYPTPISRTVGSKEAHFQLRSGLIAPVPFEELLSKLKEEFHQKAWKLRQQDELTETIGPIDGFRLRYTLGRHEISGETAMELGYGGTVIRLEHCQFIPVSDQFGETIDAALSERSEFRTVLSSHHPGRSTVTLWTYPDSFEAFGRLRKELYDLGYSVAARPLPDGVPISGSPEGSKSAVE